MGRTIWARRTYVAGNGVTAVTQFPVTVRDGTRTARQKRADVNRAARAARSAAHQLARMLNSNFVAGDSLVTLEYSPAGLRKIEARARKLKEKHPKMKAEDRMWLAADIECRNLIRRVRRKIVVNGDGSC